MGLSGYASIVRRRALALLICVLAGLGGGYYKGHHTAPTYQATARSLVSLPNVGDVSNQLVAAQLSGQLIGTYARVATSQGVAQKIVTALHLNESAGSVAGSLSASVEPSTYIIDLTASSGDPALAQSLANTAAVALSERVAELEVGAPQPVKIQVLDTAGLPSTPISPNPRSDLALGLVLGAVVGIAVMAVLESLDRTIKSGEQGSQAFGAVMLTVIPRRKKSDRLVVNGTEASIHSEPYRALRTALQFADVDAPLRTILVTSTSPGEGKTTTASNLALAFAAAGDGVVIVDGDLRRATLAENFGMEGSVGLSSLFLRSVALDDALQPWGNRVTLLPSGWPLPPNPSEILGSKLMSQLLEDLEARFDIVIIDTPPVLPVTDAVALATQVDAVVLVARHGKTQRGQAAEARRRLRAVGAPVAGFVFNAVPARESAGYYATYSYDASSQGGDRAPAVPPT